jgi:hypothetical protein
MIRGFRVQCTVLNGTSQVNGICTEAGKKQMLTFYDPDLTKSPSSQEFATKKQDRFLYVVGLISESDVGQEVSYDTDHAVGRQFVAKFVEDEYADKNGKIIQRINLSFCDMWHVDDPQVADVPKDEAKLKMIPKELRATAADKAATATKAAKADYAEPATATSEQPASLDDL